MRGDEEVAKSVFRYLLKLASGPLRYYLFQYAPPPGVGYGGMLD